MIASLIILLYLAGIIPLSSAIPSLYIAGALLLIAEIGVVSFGLLALNGLIAIYAGYTLQAGTDLVFGIPIGWEVLFGIAFVEVLIIAVVITVHMWLRSQKTTTGIEGMINQPATVLDWSGTKGKVRFEGEIWEAHSAAEMDLTKDDTVKIESVGKKQLTITA